MSDKAKEISRKLKDRAKDYFDKFVKAKESSRTSTLEVGWWGFKIKSEGLFPVLGYDSETSFYQKQKVGRSTWYRYCRLAEAFKKLPEKEFFKFNAECADHLSRLPEEKRYKPDLIKKAQELTEEEFEKVIVRFKAKEDRVEEGEVVVTLKLKMPESRRSFILDTIKEFCQKSGCDPEDHSRALELICAEERNRNPVVSVVSRVVHNMGDTLKLFNGGGSNFSADELLTKLHSEYARHVIDLCKAVGHDPAKYEKKAAVAGVIN